MPYDNEMKVQFCSKSQNESFARVVVAAFAAQLDPTVEEMADIKTAVSEAVTNAVIHGYDNKDGVIYIHCMIAEDTIYVEVKDNGRGMDNVEQAREPLFTSKPELERSGMGFTVMETFMDSLEVESSIDGGTKVFMRKQLGSASS